MPGAEMMKPDPDNRWSSCIWVALAMGKDQLVRGLDTSAFNWRGTHQCYGTPLHAILFGKISDDDDSDDGSSDNDPSAGGGNTGKKVAHDEYGDFIDKGLREKAPRLALLRVAVESGADPYLAAPESCNLTRCWTHGGDESAYVCYGGLSALECLLAHERAIRQFRADDDWRSELEAISQAVEILCRSGAQPSGQKIPVMDEIVETWGSVLADTASADVVIRVLAQGEEAAEEVSAHSVVLAQVSPVLKAMLQAGMREGSRREIEVTDCEARALRLFLSLAYTGSVRGDEDVPELDVIVQAVGLAHRWLARHVVQMLAVVLARDLDDRTFEPVADIALRLQLPQLLAACRAYTLSHPRAMRARLQSDSGPALRSVAVRAEVERLLHVEAGVEAPQKRRRRAF